MSMKKCNVCGETKHVEQMVTQAGGWRPLCKDCRSVQQKAEKLRRKERVAQEVKAQARHRQSDLCADLTPARTFLHTDRPYSTEPCYYRNDGLSAIKSRGTLC